MEALVMLMSLLLETCGHKVQPSGALQGLQLHDFSVNVGVSLTGVNLMKSLVILLSFARGCLGTLGR
ncbi:hypothetical protein L861_01905 [Litchfieldella anticariensis FP35 = DSM 16096]|uniref:Uncharacterized protein n=1 Tax=Litchfieldella anticariensis (strain DSM 16096 / CECT 5854 / CIP 108499 / LMG 22089 / FP35) TaxID=1121939 RepID=S2LHF1_LITA3|nr:hypothetical protein L861_01905 [Halomonas anticariensis FP35 = DSM 16096]